jgi:hypothetical protein
VHAERAGTNIGPFFFSETTLVRKPGLQTFRILNPREFIPEFNRNNEFILSLFPKCWRISFLTHANLFRSLEENCLAKRDQSCVNPRMVIPFVESQLSESRYLNTVSQLLDEPIANWNVGCR